jgi:hypothetical protein
VYPLRDMSHLTNGTTYLLSTVLDQINRYGLSCESRNLTSALLKNINVIVLNSETPPDLSKVVAAAESAPSNDTTIKGILRDDYDYDGALIYIIFILLFYSISVVLMIIIQTKRSEFYYMDEDNENDGNSARDVLKRIRSKNIEREALGSMLGFFSKINFQKVFF